MTQKIIIASMVMLLLLSNLTFAFENSELTIHGFASTGYMKSNHNNFLLSSKEGSFEFNEFGINFNTSISDDIRIGAQLYSFDLGDIGNNEIALDWAFLDYHHKEEISIRLGKIKTPLGLYIETFDYDMLRTCILLPQGLYNKYLREAVIGLEGVDLYGKISMGTAGILGYDAYIGSMSLSSDGGIEKFVTRYYDGWDFVSARMDLAEGGRLQWYTPIKGLKAVASFLQIDITQEHETDTIINTPSGPVTMGPINISIVIPDSQYTIYSLEYTFGNYTVSAEYLRTKYDSTVHTDMSALGQPNPNQVTVRSDSESYYGMINYRFSKWFEAGTYYSVSYSDRDDRDGDYMVADGKNDFQAWQKDLAISTLFNINESWLVKLEMHFIKGVALAYDVDNPDGFDHEDSVLYAIKTTFNF